MFQEILSIPAVKELWTGSLLDLVGIGFFGFLVYALVGGTISMIRNQTRAIYRAIATRRAAVLFVEPYTQAILSDTCTELRKLRGTYAPGARVELLKAICSELEPEVASSPLSLSFLRQFQAYLAHESKLLSSEQRKSQVNADGKHFYVGNHRGEA